MIAIGLFLLFLGFLIGLTAARCIVKVGGMGKLVVVDDPDMGVCMFLEVNEADIDELRKQSTVKLNVVDMGVIPQK